MPTVLITGANRGIGLELARQYVSDGWQVIGCCRVPEDASALRELGGKVELQKLDVADDGQIRDLAATLGGRPIDVLINNAGIFPARENLGATDTETWLHVLQVNCIAPIHLLEALLPNLTSSAQRKVISITSGLGSIGSGPTGGNYAYRTAKAALNMAMANAAAELRGKLIVVVISPGWVQTDMGGGNAPVKVSDSAAGLRRVIGGLKPADTGSFFNYDGSTIPW
jgi:NAD(P)-dependent dehydrogenase (short-subunit alcohol dehydrogenase family)